MRVRTRRGGTHEEKYPCRAAARGSRAGWVMVMAVRRMDRMERSRRDCSTRSRILGACWHPGHFPKRELHVADEKMNGRAYFFLLSFRCPLSLSSPSLHLATMSPPPPPPPPPFCLPSFPRQGKKKKLDE